ncbi:uncharacterized protein LOC142981886 [Anticarsia gemmatalis]|uniref:uncharacterized protein LOC142981886 n=1 Tax=Anticarsia gemmatalis TaxID=129554 RepID=UPI003F75DE05
MFHIGNITSSECLKSVWRAANEIEMVSDEVYDLPEICRNLDTWISSETFDVRRRLSLRTSATLINGVSRMYKIGVHKLFEDVKTLDNNMCRRKRANTSVSSDSESYHYSDLAPTPEQIRHRQGSQSVETSITPSKRTKTDSTSSLGATPSYVTHISSDESTTNETHFSHHSSVSSIVLSNNSGGRSPENIEDPIQNSPTNQPCLQNPNTNSPKNQRKDKSVQTSPTTNREERDSDSSEHVLDKDLPFGYILIHDNYHSRMPSRIILSSINSKVRDLI